MWLTQVIGSGISLVGRSPWPAADALVRLLAGRPGGRPRARAPVPHSSPERGLPESSTFPVRSIYDLYVPCEGRCPTGWRSAGRIRRVERSESGSAANGLQY